MSNEMGRDLTTLEYMVLGITSIQPQSGYSILTNFESGGYLWTGSASPGSIYPMLKRLEKQGILSSELEMVHETRPRKMYSLTPLGEEMLDDWLKRPLTRREVIVKHGLVLKKFLLIAERFAHQEILAWLDDYERETKEQQMILQMQDNPELRGTRTVPYQLFVEAIAMELNMQQEWIQKARERLEEETGEELTTDQA